MNKVNELIKQAEALFEKKEYKNIIDLLPDEILNKHNDADLYAWRAWAHNRLKEADLAFNYSEKAIIANPDNSFGFQQRGSAWFIKGDYDNALADYDMAIWLKNDDAVSYLNRGNVFNEQGQYDKAISNYNKAIGLKKDFAYAYASRGNVYLSLKNYDKALTDYDKAIELRKDDSTSHNNRGIIFAERKEYDKAISDYSMSIELNPKDTNAYNNRGITWADMGEYDKAFSDFNTAIELNLSTANLYRNRGNVFYKINDFKKAIEDYLMAIRLDEKFNFLEKNIKLAKEKLEERNILEERNAFPKDKEEKLKIEKEIELQINTIRELSKSEVKKVVHYTKVFVADVYVKSVGSKMHYSNAIYMNDPMEGKAFFDYLNDEKIKAAYFNGEKRTETSVYLGSFLPAEENDGEISHEDELVMWRTYGKDENGKEASGCSVVLSSDFFKIKTRENNESATVDISEELLNVIYIKNLKYEKKVTNDPKEKIEPAIESLKDQLKLIIKLRDKYQPTDDFYKDIENTIFKQLSTISYLFKSSDYSYEHEVRVITYMPRDSELIKYIDNTELNAPHKRFFIESYNEILPYIKKIFLGPKVENYQQWSLYFDFEIRQRAKEISTMPFPPYIIKPSDIEIMKSDCKFQ